MYNSHLIPQMDEETLHCCSVLICGTSLSSANRASALQREGKGKGSHQKTHHCS